MLPKLTYFDVRGRAESIRLMLEDSGTEYTERRIKLEEWQALKPTFPMQQVPVYEEGEGADAVYLFHSAVIRRYLARKLGLDGKNEQERLACEMVVESIGDAQVSIGSLMWNPNFADLRGAYEKETLPAILQKLQKQKDINQDSRLFWVGGDITYADFIAWAYLDYVRALSTPVLQQFPNLHEFYLQLAQRPRVAAYLASDRRAKTLTVPMAPFGGTPQTS